MGSSRVVTSYFILVLYLLSGDLGRGAVAAVEEGGVNKEGKGLGIHQELIDASAVGNLNRVKSLLKLHADVNWKGKGTTALIEASYHGHSDVVSTLILAGADLSAQDEAGFSALHAATQKGNIDVVKTLLESGADTELMTRKGSTPLYLSALYGYENITEALLGYGAKKNILNFQGVPVLYIAAQKGFYGVVTLLLDAGANVDEANLESEATPLMVATENGHLKICDALIKSRADVNAQNIYGASPLHLAVAGARLVSIAEQLLVSGANINIKDDNQDTPLHWAARFGNLSAIKLLLESGADPLAKGRLQQTPADIICGCEQHQGSKDLFQCPEMSCSKDDKVSIKAILGKGVHPLPKYENIRGSKRQKESTKRVKNPPSTTPSSSLKLKLKPKAMSTSINSITSPLPNDNLIEEGEVDLSTLLD